MDRSLGFVSTPYDYFARLTLAFASASERCPLTSPYSVTRWLIMQKARRQPFPQSGHRPPTACKLLVSDSISLP